MCHFNDIIRTQCLLWIVSPFPPKLILRGTSKWKTTGLTSTIHCSSRLHSHAHHTCCLQRPHQSISDWLQEHPHHHQHGVAELQRRLAEEEARRRWRLRCRMTEEHEDLDQMPMRTCGSPHLFYPTRATAACCGQITSSVSAYKEQSARMCWDNNLSSPWRQHQLSLPLSANSDLSTTLHVVLKIFHVLKLNVSD